MKNDIIIRHATYEDAELLFHWHIDIDARKNSFSEKIPDKLDHKKWLKESLNDTNKILLIGLHSQTRDAIGVVRLDIKTPGDFGEISINLDSKWRSKKLSVSFLTKAIEEIGKSHSLVLVAKIKPVNIISQRCFQSCGFALYEETDTEFVYQNKILIINQIEKIRSNNNVNWMNLMRLAFRVAPKEAEKIFKDINVDDGSIAKLLKQLTKTLDTDQ